MIKNYSQYLIKEDYYQQGPCVFPDYVDLNTNSPVQAKLQVTYNDENTEINAVRAKFNEIRKKLGEDASGEYAKWISKKIKGKILIDRIYKSGNSGNFVFSISRAISVECKSNEKAGQYNYGYYGPNLTIEVKCENGNVCKGWSQGGFQARILDRVLNYLKGNVGKEITFTGSKLSDINAYKKSKPRTKSINKIFYDHNKRYSTKLETIGVTNIPKIGDYITFNDEYLFNPDQYYEFVSRRIDAVDPYGEENWADEVDWEAPIGKTIKGIGGNVGEENWEDDF
jgi:hypothetical protein